MKKLIFVALVALSLLPVYSYGQEVMPKWWIPFGVPYEVITQEAAKHELATINRFYDVLSSPDDATSAERLKSLVAANWLYVPASIGGLWIDDFATTLAAFHQSFPDVKWTVQSIIKSGNTYTVRSAVSGTPVYDFLGMGQKWIPGNSFEIMSIDIHTFDNYGKIANSFHIEDWKSAMQQLSTPVDPVDY